MWKSPLDDDYIIHQGCDLVSDLALNGSSRQILEGWNVVYGGCISAEMIDRWMLRPDCRTKGSVILQVGIIITSLPETDQSLLQDTERRVRGFDCTRANEKDDHDGEIWSALPDVSQWKQLVIWNEDNVTWPEGRDVRFWIQWSEGTWDMCCYRPFCFLPLSQQTRLVPVTPQWNSTSPGFIVIFL